MEADEERMESCSLTHHWMGALTVLGGGVAPVARILAQSSLVVPLFYWTTRLTLWRPQIGP